jgi:hypothetical protein
VIPAGYETELGAGLKLTTSRLGPKEQPRYMLHKPGKPRIPLSLKQTDISADSADAEP